MQTEKGEKETTSDGISTPSQPLDSSVIETTPSPNSTPNVREPEVQKRWLIENVEVSSNSAFSKQPIPNPQ